MTAKEQLSCYVPCPTAGAAARGLEAGPARVQRRHYAQI